MKYDSQYKLARKNYHIIQKCNWIKKKPQATQSVSYVVLQAIDMIVCESRQLDIFMTKLMHDDGSNEICVYYYWCNANYRHTAGKELVPNVWI